MFHDTDRPFRRRALKASAIAAPFVAVLVLLVSLPSLERYFVVEMLVRAIKTDENALETSDILASAMQRVREAQAQEQAADKLIPLLEFRDERVCLRARFCILCLKLRFPRVLSALINLYRNPAAPVHMRIDTVGMLVSLAPDEAEACGAGAARRRYRAKYSDLMFANQNDADVLAPMSESR